MKPSRRDRAIFGIALVLLFGLPGSTPAAPPDPPAAAHVATVDFATLLAFHPLARYYVPERGLFLRPLPESDPAELGREIARRKTTFDVLSATIQKRSRELEDDAARAAGEAAAARDRRASGQADLSRKFADEFPKLREAERPGFKDRHRRALADLEAEERSALARTEDRLVALRAEREAMFHELRAVHFQSESEEVAFRTRIESECREVCTSEAARIGAAVVLDTGRFAAAPEPPVPASDPTLPAENGAVAGLKNYEQIRADLTPLAGTGGTTAAELAVRISVRHAQRRSIGAALAKPSPLVVGGADITRAALERILDRYGVDPTRRTVLLEGVSP